MRLDEGWNQIQFNLSDFTRRAYGTNYIETLRVQIHANCRIRRIYFSDRLYSEEELPPEFKLFLPVKRSENVANTEDILAEANAAPAQGTENVELNQISNDDSNNLQSAGASPSFS